MADELRRAHDLLRGVAAPPDQVPTGDWCMHERCPRGWTGGHHLDVGGTRYHVHEYGTTATRYAVRLDNQSVPSSAGHETLREAKLWAEHHASLVAT